MIFLVLLCIFNFAIVHLLNTFKELYDITKLKPGFNDSVLCYTRLYGVGRYTTDNNRWIGVELVDEKIYPIIVDKDCSVEPVSLVEFENAQLLYPYMSTYQYCHDLWLKLHSWADKRVDLGKPYVFPIPLGVGLTKGQNFFSNESMDGSTASSTPRWLTWIPLLITLVILVWRLSQRNKLKGKLDEEPRTEKMSNEVQRPG